MASRVAIKRLTAEYKELTRNPIPFILARPSENNILLWYFLLTGPPDSQYEGGQYVGQLKFPPNYPFGPPNIKMITPNGRFQVNTSLCLSMSDFHKESWNPAWNVGTILTGLLSFMTSEEMSSGVIKCTERVRKQYAERSVKWNLKNEVFRTVYPDMMQKIEEDIEDSPDNYQSVIVKLPKNENEAGTQFSYQGVGKLDEETAAKLLLDPVSTAPKKGGRNNIEVLGAVVIIVVAVIFYYF